jgi:hypothetical protein
MGSKHEGEKSMDAEEFDSLRPFRSVDATLMEIRAARVATLGVALFGRTSDYLRNQLLAPHPEIPSGFDLPDFRALHEWLMKFPRFDYPRYGWLSASSTIRTFFQEQLSLGPNGSRCGRRAAK